MSYKFTKHSFLIAFILLVGHCSAQEVFRKRYVFNKEKFKKENLFLKEEKKVGNKDTTIYKSKDLGWDSRYGRITKRSKDGDTLFIVFWDMIDTIQNKGSGNIINFKDNGATFAYVIRDPQWRNNKGFIHNYLRFKIPYQYRTITATNIPYRVNVNSGNLDADFTNFNIAHFWVWGRTKFFEKPFIEPRNFHFGLGPFVGLTSLTTNKAEEEKGLGISYGANVVFSLYNFNLIGAFGWDTGFKDEAKKTSPWIGFGIGFKLVDLFSPTAGEED